MSQTAVLGTADRATKVFRPGVFDVHDHGIRISLQSELDLASAPVFTAGTAVRDGRDLLSRARWRVCLTRPRPAVPRLLDLAVTAGWFPPEAACAAVEFWGPVSPTRMTTTPWWAVTCGPGTGSGVVAVDDGARRGSS